MKIHIVKQGDSLYEIAKKYNVPLEKLIEANPQITNPEVLNLGDKIKIPANAVPVNGGAGKVYDHTVKSGDSLWKLSKAWGLPLQALIEANPQLVNPNELKVGEVIHIPTKGTQTSPAPSSPSNPANPNTNISPIATAPSGKKNTAPITTTPVEKKNTAPVAEKKNTAPVVEKKEETKPIVNEPVKKTPIQLEVEVEHFTYETVKHENKMHVQPAKAEKSACPPIAEYPVLPSPYAYQFDVPSNIAPISASPASPCGCSGNVSNQPNMPHQNLFYQYQVPAQPVNAYYETPQYTQVQPAFAETPWTGEYPGISNAPAYQQMDNNPNMYGVSNYPSNLPNQPFPAEISPMSIAENSGFPATWGMPAGNAPFPGNAGTYPANAYGGNAPFPAAPAWGGMPMPYGYHQSAYGAVMPGAMTGAVPATPEIAGMTGGPALPQGNIPAAPLGGFGVNNNAGHVGVADNVSPQSLGAAKGKSNAKARKSAKISSSKKSRSKSRKRTALKSEGDLTKNPWINQ
ncbi:LysM peptidoglycan-binding domain-containing protein [Paenibacillus brevis]|uniref:LysM peptidoglycan-binding domain-containing protein n=1 Tax=Paenibacillus brevis TaxID=2841508 RepID=A0ABS6FZY5_9BACL|nr:LysM peptidoglycan-binding domain-containing protein [Paenibacillus brevis]